MNDIDPGRVLETQRNIPGYMAEGSAAVWCVLLRAQHETWLSGGRAASGDYLEIGVFNGKSASVLANFSKAYGNRLAIVDPQILPKTKETLDAISPRVKYIESRSEELQASGFYANNRRRIAFAHIDGLHRFSVVISDLRTCEGLLADFGIIAIDDFHSDGLFPQVSAAVYKYLFSGVSDLSIFLVGFNKAYLCRNCAKSHFMQVSRAQLLPELETLGQKVTLAKTDRNDAFDAFTITSFFENRLYGSEHT